MRASSKLNTWKFKNEAIIENFIPFDLNNYKWYWSMFLYNIWSSSYKSEDYSVIMLESVPSQVLSPIPRIELFMRRYLIIISKTTEEYVSGVYDRKRMIMVTTMKISLILNTIRFGLSALFNKVLSNLIK